jgi:acyl-CoA synthetase (AMP-forming)/AMP-acid ligase II/acyl carrier protein
MGDNAYRLDQLALRFIRSSSSSLAPELMRGLESKFNVPVIEAYGMTEAAHQIASNPLPPGERKAGSVGKDAGPKISIMAEEGESLLPAGKTGEIVIRGETVTAGYLRNPEANRQAFVSGWFRTGDQGYFDEDGYLHITGRLKEIINRGGEKISPREVDEVLLRHPAVENAITFAVADDLLGEDIAAAIVIKDGTALERQDIRRHVNRTLATFKVPRVIVFLDRIPLGSTGKPQRIGLAEVLANEIAQQAAQEHAADPSAPGGAIEKQVAEIWSEILRVDDIDTTVRFTELGGDSLLAAKLAMMIRKTFELDIDMVEFFEAATVRNQAELIATWRGKA